ncbi:nSTAND1 domain-containing NTPase [Actinoplanes subglobosus]|uniref:Trypsin-like peptidase domain-containing protein n=1 Tax=Actinoplanes subglobosus TaxID=1547892 RepID=A0ABV8J5E5_9ACTN
MSQTVDPVRVPAAGGLEPAIVRIRGDDGRVAGVGFLAGDRTVLTCAHVVQRAGSVRLDFPLLPGSATFAAEVVALLPVLADGSGDIAVLRLAADPPCTAWRVPMVEEAELWGHPCRLFGFSGGREDGVWVAGILRGRQGIGWVQLESSGNNGYAVEPGFSGSPVWDDELAAVVGMAVAAEVDGDLRAAYMIPAAALAEAWPDLGEMGRAPCPYRGLAAFREQDADVYFGREDRTAQLAKDIEQHNFVAVVGPSGSGKSSLVFGGLLPIVHRSMKWVTATMRPAQASSGVAALAAALLPVLEPSQSETQRLLSLSQLTEVLRNGHVHAVLSRMLMRSGANRLLLIIDQFEEVFGTPDTAELTEILLAGLGLGEVTAVITLRADFFGQALQLPALAQALGESVAAVGEMDRRQLQRVIEGPLPRGTTYEPGLVDRILDDVGDSPSGSLPLLEFALTLLWERRERGRLTHAAYQQLGGVKGALAQYAEQVYRQQAEESGRESFRRLLTQLVRPDEGGEFVRRLTRRQELAEGQWLLGQKLATTRLVTAGRDELGSETLELVHEALIDGWDRLRGWAEQDRAFRAWQEGLRGDVADWERLKQDSGALLRGKALAEAAQWLDEREDDIAAAERRYIQSSQVFEGRSIRRLRVIVAALTVLTVLVAGLGAFAVKIGRDKARQAAQSQARYLTSQAEMLNEASVPNGRILGLLLSAAAYRFYDDNQTRANLTAVASKYRYVSHLVPGVILPGLMSVGSAEMEFSPSEPNVLAVRIDGQIALWDVESRKMIQSTPTQLSGPGWGHGMPMAFAPDGGSLAFAENGRLGTRVKLWRLAAGDAVPLWTDQGPEAAVVDIRFDPAGERVAVCRAKDYQVWSLDASVRLLSIPRAAEGSCLFSWTSNGADLTIAEDDRLETWTISTRKRRGSVRLPLPALEDRVTNQDNVINGFSVAPHGHVAFVKAPGGIIWWDLERRKSLPGYGVDLLNAPSAPTYSADGRWAFFTDGSLMRESDREPVRKVPIYAGSDGLSSGGESGKVVALSRDGKVAVASFEGSLAVVHLDDFDPLPMGPAAEFSMWDDGSRVTTLEYGDIHHPDVSQRTVTTWSLAPPRVVARVKIEPFSDEETVLSPEISGGLVVAVDKTRTLRQWDLRNAPSSHPVHGPWGPLRAAALDPTNNFLATVDKSRAYVVNLSTGATIANFALGEGFLPTTLALSAGGRYLSVTNQDSNRSTLWQITSDGVRTVPIPAATDTVFSPDGTLLGMSSDDSVVVWDLARQTELRRFSATSVAAFDRKNDLIALRVPGKGFYAQVVEVRRLHGPELIFQLGDFGGTDVIFNADGTGLVARFDEVLTEYPLDINVSLRHICHLVSIELSDEEWQKYAKGFPRRDVCS